MFSQVAFFLTPGDYLDWRFWVIFYGFDTGQVKCLDGNKGFGFITSDADLNDVHGDLVKFRRSPSEKKDGRFVAEGVVVQRC